MKKSWFILFLIILIGGLVRLINLNDFPIALAGDEAAFGYSAYSIFETQKDEYGQFLPLYFKSFGDYKLPVMVYFLTPIVGVFGLNELTIRLPIAILGILLIPLSYLISKKVFEDEVAALITGLLIAISPWAINFSRGAWEANMGLFLVTLGAYLLLIGLKKTIWQILGLICLLISMYTYHAEKVVAPLLIIVYGCFFIKQIPKSNLLKGINLGLILIFLLPLLIGLTNMSGLSRAQGSLINDYIKNPLMKTVYETDAKSNLESTNFLYLNLFHSFPILAINDILVKSYAYISPAQLFVYGDVVKRHGVVDFGLLYPFDFILLVLAMIFLIQTRLSKPKWLILLWLFFGFMPAMLTRDTLHSIRSLVAVVPLYIIEGLGFSLLLKLIIERIKKLSISSINQNILQLLSFSLIGLVIVIYFSRFLISYFVITPYYRADGWQYGYKQMVQQVMSYQDQFANIVIDTPKLYGNPYIFFLFYGQYDPLKYNQLAKRQDDLHNRVVAVYQFDKYQFREIYWPDDRGKGKTLYVGTDISIPKQDVNEPDKMKILDEIKLPDGTVVFRIVETY